jgi:hypothetical protein
MRQQADVVGGVTGSCSIGVIWAIRLTHLEQAGPFGMLLTQSSVLNKDSHCRRAATLSEAPAVAASELRFKHVQPWWRGPHLAM